VPGCLRHGTERDGLQLGQELAGKDRSVELFAGMGNLPHATSRARFTIAAAGNRGQALHVNVLVTQFKRLIRTAGLPDLRIHNLRHTSATLLLAQGVHPKIVQKRLGHADISMTLNRSSHVTLGMQ
jgi:integrase